MFLLKSRPLAPTNRIDRGKILLGVALGVVTMVSAHAQDWIPSGFQYPVGTTGDRSGTSIAVHTFTTASGEQRRRLFIGAPDAKVGTLAGAGGVFVYTNLPGGGAPWIGFMITSPTPQAGAHFGASVAFSNEHLIVGSPDYNDPSVASTSGRIDFFADSDVVTPTLTSEGFQTSNGGNLGSAVAIDGDKAIASTPTAGDSDGCINTYRFDTTTKTWSFFPAQAVALRCGRGGSVLGASVAIREIGDTGFIAVAGAPGESQNGNALAGGAHVYLPSSTETTGGGLLELSALAAASPTTLDAFGSSVGIDDNFVYVGGVGRSNGLGRVGSVTVFSPAPGLFAGYQYLSEYFPADPATVGGRCGASLSVDSANGQFIIGCPNSTDDGTTGVGTARVYKQVEFLGQPVWLESVLRYGDQVLGANALGTSVAIDGIYAYAGAPNYGGTSKTNEGEFQVFIEDPIFADGLE